MGGGGVADKFIGTCYNCGKTWTQSGRVAVVTWRHVKATTRTKGSSGKSTWKSDGKRKGNREVDPLQRQLCEVVGELNPAVLHLTQ